MTSRGIIGVYSGDLHELDSVGSGSCLEVETIAGVHQGFCLIPSFMVTWLDGLALDELHAAYLSPNPGDQLRMHNVSSMNGSLRFSIHGQDGAAIMIHVSQ